MRPLREIVTIVKIYTGLSTHVVTLGKSQMVQKHLFVLPLVRVAKNALGLINDTQ